ncbi:hypothetical protein HRbin25_00970 [bacterium HR25]|jgi:quinol monooxygenase YgiN|nr:hypothetical protein HRbin25_00970 [bacterium HR25]
MFTLLARLKLQPGKRQEALPVLEELARQVEANEPDTLAYLFHFSQDDPDEVVVFELYRDEDAFRFHRRAPHVGELFKRLGALMVEDGARLERLDRLTGFVRKERL